MISLGVLIAAFVASGTIAVYASDTNRRRLLNVTKPLTTVLLFAIAGPPHGMFAVAVWIGIALSLGGDIALLFDANKAFLIGLALFLLAYGTYAVAFITAGHLTHWLPAFVVVAGISTTQLLRRLWPGAVGMHGPVIAYGVVISAMMVGAWTTNGGALGVTAGHLVSVGATLLYISDSSLALDKFSRPIPHVAVLTMGVYWLGQLAIALAAR
jgi:uncharacterized membrane protein YhhN